MSSLVKLSISGIRSYDNRGRETMQFSKPLTLIAGPNGVGKTTIIEALKYATTGDMPPNSRGGAFVHDPKMSGERQVLGQVKLGYYNARGQQMVVTRSMQLTQNRKTPTFKTLDGQLLIVVDGAKETLSSRCADLDVQVPLSLGVSTPVLDYVIFCHQEDSMWPLSEPSLVKKRFDDIFEATKYSKALDAIKTLRKDYTSDIKLQEQTVEYLQQDNERAVKMAKSIDQLTVRIQNLNAEAEATKTKMDKTVSHLNTLFKKNQDFQKVISELNQARSTATLVENQIEVVQTDLEVLDEPTASIKEKLRDFDGDEYKLQELAEQLISQQSHTKSSLEQRRDSLARLTRQRGVLENERENYERKLVQIQEIIKAITEYYKTATSSAPSEITEFLEQRITAAQSQYTGHQTKARDEKRGLQQSIDEINSRKSSQQHKIESLRDQIAANDQECKSLARELQDHASSGAGGNAKYQESRLVELKQQLEAINQSIADDEYSHKINAASQQIAGLKQLQERTSRDLIKASTRFNENSRVMVQKDNLSKKQFHIKDLKQTLANALRNFQKSGTNTKRELEEILATIHQQQGELTGEKTECETRVQQINAEADVLAKEQRETKSQIETIAKNMQTEGIHLPGFQTNLKDVEEDLEVATQNLEQTTFSTQYYETARIQAQEQSKCILCQHKFNKSELSSFLELINAKISSIPITKEDAAASFEETRKEAEKLRSLVGDYSQWSSLTSKLPSLKEKLDQLSREKTILQGRIDNLETSLTSSKDQKSDLEPLEKNMAELERLEQEEKQLETEINEAVSSSAVDDQTPQNVQDRLEEVNNELQEAESRLSRYKEMYQQQRESVADTQNKISKKQLDLKNLELKEQSLEMKSKRVGELKQQNALLESRVPGLESQLGAFQDELHAATSELTRVSELQIQKEHELLEERSMAEKFSNKIAPLVAEVQEYSPDKLEQLAAQISEQDQEVHSLENQIQDMAEKIQVNDRKIVNSRGQKRVLQDNVQLRSYQQQLQEIRAKINELEGQGAEGEKDEFERQTSTLQNELGELSSSHSLKLGQVKSLAEQKSGLEKDLASDFANVHTKYYSASTRLDCTKNATDDLNKYTKALDGAIMMYHSIKMEEINQVLDELWKDTYMGTDIDTIKIKSETESTKTRTTHNYRVVMYKQGVELDMRGRCSAGQKLLGCVLIRLALSECFGLNCGFLVLDEPTTNLDVFNIQSLGRSLCRIIETRRAQKNFQLIVITHDEHFLTYLGASNFCDTFFRLYRDSHQHSKIEELPITQLG